MNVLVVDTSCWITYFKGLPNDDIDLALKEGRVYLPLIVAAELLSGRLKPRERDKLSEFLQELPLCAIEIDHWIRVGDLRSRAALKGINISTPDAHIAQCSLDLNGYLLSEDGIFPKLKASVIPALKLIRGQEVP